MWEEKERQKKMENGTEEHRHGPGDPRNLPAPGLRVHNVAFFATPPPASGESPRRRGDGEAGEGSGSWRRVSPFSQRQRVSRAGGSEVIKKHQRRQPRDGNKTAAKK